jgi:hypothetical protein
MKQYFTRWCRGLLVLSTLAAGIPCSSAADTFVGNWALTIPGGGAGWLGVREAQGKLAGDILWGGGSVVPVSSIAADGKMLVLTRQHERKKKGADGKETGNDVTETIKATMEGDVLKLTTQTERNGQMGTPTSFTGKRIPPLPAAPDLAKVQFGPAIQLFNGKDLTGWRTFGSSAEGWKAENGILVNNAPQEPGKHKSYANIRTEREFEDFNLTLEMRVPKGGNSGIYLRGLYEVQVADSYGKPAESHQMGAVYSRITPTENSCKPAGEWQTYDLALVDRHITVILNGKKIIDNQPVLGCTGGALSSDEFRPGPLYLQGDHTSVDYRNIVLRPVVK